MQKRKDRTISLILAVALFLGGMYLNAVTQETFFLRGHMGNAVIRSKVFQIDINNDVVCMTDMLGECDKEEQQSFEMDRLLYLLCSNHIKLFMGMSFERLQTIQSLLQASDAISVDYMHQSDGKKRN